MEEWTDEFITSAQQELTGMVEDWKYDYGADDRAWWRCCFGWC